MDKRAIENYSNTVREKLREEIGDRLSVLGFTRDEIFTVDTEYEDAIVVHGRVFDKKIKKQRAELEKQVREKGFSKVLDEVTYTWFNRFTALKFMEANRYLPVLPFSSSTKGKDEPDILGEALEHSILRVDRDRVLEFKEKGEDEKLYKYLLLQLCRYLHRVMPFLFEDIEDYTELLFPGRLLHTDSIIHDLNDIIPTQDWKEVEIIGWIYQAYISDKKDKLIQAKNKYKSDQVGTVTQLFTPSWIVRYMVQNSLGRYWLEHYPESELKEQMEFYIELQEGERKQSASNSSLRPSVEDITFIDPAMGSGHILVYAFEIFYEIYKNRGFIRSEIPELILSNNLYGLEIDDRCTQLAGFALFMKARQYDRHIFEKGVELNIMTIRESNGFSDEDIRFFCGDEGDFDKVKTFFDTYRNASTLGSIIKTGHIDIDHIIETRNVFQKSETIEKYGMQALINNLIKETHLLQKKYQISVTNPPYVNSRYMPTILKEYVKENYPDTKKDLFAVFMELLTDLTQNEGHIGMVTPYVWMFLSSYEKLRDYLLDSTTITSLVQLEYNAFEPACIPVCTFTLKNRLFEETEGGYIKLSDFRGHKNQAPRTLEAIDNPNYGWFHTASASDFKKIPGSPIAYWVSDNLLDVFENSIKLVSIASPRQGLATGKNHRFVRNWQEVSYNNIGIGLETSIKAQESGLRWFPYNKGGEYRKWYGNQEFIVNWEKDGKEIKNFTDHNGKLRSRPQNTDYYFKESLSWSKITSSGFALRLFPNGHIFDVAGCSIFIEDDYLEEIILGSMNSHIMFKAINSLSPTLNFEVGQVATFPIIKSIIEHQQISTPVQELVNLARSDWDAYERSWDFTELPLLKTEFKQPAIEESYTKLRQHWKEMTLEMRKLEKENNRIFIEAYGLEDELTPEVPLEEITLTCNPWYRYSKKCDDFGDGFPIDEELEDRLLTDTMKELISYAVGCMFGRYSPDKPGLILANQGETLEDFKDKVPDAGFLPDENNIIPILDADYFRDDIVTYFRRFLAYTFGEKNLSENLEFVADAIRTRKKRRPAEEEIRYYFTRHFFKDHCRTYKRRPIYWLFSTGGRRRSFQALIYMHRYDKTTLARLRHDYLLEFESKCQARLEILREDDSAPARRIKKLEKYIEDMVEYDELLKSKADEYIEIDLDDGVKQNYPRFKGLLRKI